MSSYEDDLFEPVSDEAAVAAAGDLADPANPLSTAVAFAAAVLAADGPDLSALRQLCTPESWKDWDFDEAGQLLGNCGLTTHAARPSTGEPDVRYAKFLPSIGDGETCLQVKSVGVVNVYVLTLQYRPEAGLWMAHALGDYVLPEDLPRT
ncbi:hypothetical protein [Streptomyces sp. NPDC007346]|uniref:hypothetical protein n=1 Tax=Streptomyces sp. NPDC007346 TaxID=3154682 RepID=UPI0034558D82